MSDERTCAHCGDTVQYLSSDDLCDGCAAQMSHRESRRISDELTRLTEELGLYE